MKPNTKRRRREALVVALLTLTCSWRPEAFAQRLAVPVQVAVPQVSPAVAIQGARAPVPITGANLSLDLGTPLNQLAPITLPLSLRPKPAVGETTQGLGRSAAKGSARSEEGLALAAVSLASPRAAEAPALGRRLSPAAEIVGRESIGTADLVIPRQDSTRPGRLASLVLLLGEGFSARTPRLDRLFDNRAPGTGSIEEAPVPEGGAALAKGTALDRGSPREAESSPSQDQGPTRPAQKPESRPGPNPSALIDIGLIGLVYPAWNSLLRPAAGLLGAWIQTGFDAATHLLVNLPHFLVAWPGYLGKAVAAGFAQSAPVLAEFAHQSLELAGAPAWYSYVFGTLHQVQGLAALGLSHGMELAAPYVSSASNWIVQLVPTFHLDVMPTLALVPAEWWWMGAVGVAAFRYKDTLWRWLGRWEKIATLPGVPRGFLRLLGVGVAANAMPTLLARDAWREAIYPVIRPVWEFVKDAWDWLYRRVLTPLGHGGRAVGVATAAMWWNAMAFPPAMAAALGLNYLVTPTYRLILAVGRMLRERPVVGTVLLAGLLSLGALGLVTGWPTLAAWSAAFGPLAWQALKWAWWLSATAAGLAALPFGLYFGYQNPFLKGVIQASGKITGTMRAFLIKALDTLRKAGQQN